MRSWITFSAFVIDCKIPFSMFSRLSGFSVMLKIVLGRKVLLWSSRRVDIILISFLVAHWRCTEHSPEKVIYILNIYQLQCYKIKEKNTWNLPVWDHYFGDPSLQVWLRSGQVWDENCAEAWCRYHLSSHVRNIRILIGQEKWGIIACLLTCLQTTFLFVLCLCSMAILFLISAFFFLGFGQIKIGDLQIE